MSAVKTKYSRAVIHEALRYIINVIAHDYCVTSEAVVSTSQSGKLSEIRHICMYILKENTDWILYEIGDNEVIKGNKHSNVYSSIRKIKGYVDMNTHYGRQINIYSDLFAYRLESNNAAIMYNDHINSLTSKLLAVQYPLDYNI